MITKIDSMEQVDFINERDICYDRRSNRPCFISNGVLIIGDAGVIIDEEVLKYYDIVYFWEQDIEQ